MWVTVVTGFVFRPFLNSQHEHQGGEAEGFFTDRIVDCRGYHPDHRGHRDPEPVAGTDSGK